MKQIYKVLYISTLLVFFGGILHSLSAQDNSLKIIESAKLTKVKPDEYEIDFNKQFILAFPYGKSTFSNSEDALLLKYLRVKKVVLVYTWHSFGKSQDIRQTDLNSKRLQELYKRAPYLFTNEDIEWELVVQTDYQHPDHEKELFHGFIIHYQFDKAMIPN